MHICETYLTLTKSANGRARGWGDMVEMARSSRQQRHARSSCLHGSLGSGSGRARPPPRRHGTERDSSASMQRISGRWQSSDEPGMRQRQPDDDEDDIPICYAMMTRMAAGSIGSRALRDCSARGGDRSLPRGALCERRRLGSGSKPRRMIRCRRIELVYNGWLYCIEASAGIYEYRRHGEQSTSLDIW